MIIGSLFSGIGGLELGLEWAGFGPTIWQVENNEKLHGVLETHWPNAERFTDIRDVGKHNLKPVDLICGGFPCQDISSAGKRVGLSGSRSGLWYEMARVIKELRPRWVVVENVASGAKKWTDEIRCDLGELGYATLPIPIAASDVGAWHERKRVFIVAYLNGDGKSIQSEYAEMAASSELASTNSYGDTIREQPRRRERKNRKGSTKPNKTTPDINRTRSQGRTESEASRTALTCSAGHSGWMSEPGMARMVHGFPGRVDTISALGNSVVPQQAQVIGEVINILTENK